MTRYIAIIKTDDSEWWGGEDELIVRSITDWAEVDEDTFQKLEEYRLRGKFKIIEQPIDTDAFIENTVEAHTRWVREQDAIRAKELAVEKKRKEDAAAKKAARRVAKERKILEELKKKYDNIAP